nr:hypothetical protein [Tanacetum cinerariifolium]
DRVFKIKDALGNKQYKPEDIQELFRELLNDVQNIHEELAEYINTPSWNRPVFYNNDDDDDEDCTIAITPNFPITDSLKLESTPKNDRFDTEPYLLESLPNRDTLMSSTLKIDSFLAEFAGALIFLKSIPPEIDEADCDPEEDIHLVERIDSLMEEIDLPFNPDDPMPPGIEDDDHDSERDILILEELLENYSLLLLDNESYHFDIPLPYRPPANPPDGKTRTLNIKIMGDVSDQKVPIPGLTITCILNQEKSPDLLPHQGLEAFQPSPECPRMIINGKNTPDIYQIIHI